MHLHDFDFRFGSFVFCLGGSIEVGLHLVGFRWFFFRGYCKGKFFVWVKTNSSEDLIFSKEEVKLFIICATNWGFFNEEPYFIQKFWFIASCQLIFLKFFFLILRLLTDSCLVVRMKAIKMQIYLETWGKFELNYRGQMTDM